MNMRNELDGTADVVVIGTGAGGAPVLAELAKAGLRVVALEAGQPFKAEDHSTDETVSDIYWMDERLSDGEMPQVFGSNNSGKGVGGSTLHWGAFCPRPDPRDLKLQSLTGQGVDWPLDMGDLLPHLEAVERFISVSGPADYPWDPGRTYPNPPPWRNAPAERMMEGCAALGITATDGPTALVTRPVEQPHWGVRGACVDCGKCHQGCRVGSKASMDITYLPMAEAHGAEIRSGAMVYDMERDARGRISAVLYWQDGSNHRLACKAVFLCAGGVETPRLLLNLGLANSSEQVGRNYMAHVATQVWGIFDQDMRMNHGYPSAIISEDMLRPADADFAGGYLMQSLGVLPVTLTTSLVRGAGLWGEKLVRMLENYRHLGGIGINGECLPHEDNQLRLSPERDAFGLRKAHVTFSYHDNEKAMDRHARDTMTRIWTAAGARDVFAVPRAAHTIGTCRMGEDPARSVVDPNGRSHDIENLWICDNSVFPSSIVANPALLIMGLSLRSANIFLRGGV